MKAADILLLLTLNSFLNLVLSHSEFNDEDESMFKSADTLNEKSPNLHRKPVVSMIDPKIAAYESLQKPYNIVHEANGNDDDKIEFVANEGAGKPDSNSQSNQKPNSSISWVQNSGVLAGIICTCLLLGLILFLLVVFCIYRLRKRDEGSYALDEPKKMLPPSSEYSKAPTREFYA